MPRRAGKNLTLAIVGQNGRMGLAVAELAKAHGFTVKPAFADPVDVVIEFSSPAGLLKALKWCQGHKVPLVSGTTGLNASHYRALRSTARKLPILHAPNMSLGIAALRQMLSATRALPDWDVQVEELHHKHKKDRPSGTAKLLDQRLAEVRGTKPPKAQSIRGGSIPGIHQVWLMGQDEFLCLQHTALDRRVFARGALHAARWLFDKKRPGLYDLVDLYPVTRRS